MSYILDALKKAETDRHAGTALKIDAPVARFLAPPPRRVRHAPWLWIVVSTAAVLVACFLWLGPFSKDQEKKEEVLAVATAPAERTESTQQTQPAQSTKPTEPAEPITAMPQPSDIVEKKAKPLPAAKPVPKRMEKKAAARKPAATTPVVQEPAKMSKAETSKTEVAREEAPLPILSELPEQIQREIPRFALDGYLYSDNEADRSVLINRRLLHEGDEIASGLVLERMTRKGMVLSYRGYRYQAPY